MDLFHYDDIRTLNETELQVYNYIAAHPGQAADMSIRQLAAAAGVSTTTLFRFCKKVGCAGFQELKYRLKRTQEAPHPHVSWPYPQDSHQVVHFLQQLEKNTAMQQSIAQAAEILASAQLIYLLGIGSSGALADYGARYFANLGLPAVARTDPFFPKPQRDLSHCAVTALSVSGETTELNRQVLDYKELGACIISITNTSVCHLATLSDLNLNYYMPALYTSPAMGPHNLTTQLPVIYLLETLARQAAVPASSL